MNQRHPDLPHILFLYSDTGGGHRSAAEAIIEALNLEFPGQFTTEMVDIFREYAPAPLDKVPDIYPPLTRMPRVWGLGYHISDGPRRTKVFYQAIWPYIRRGVKRLVEEHPADLVVSVHQLDNTPVARALAPHQIPFATVVTDLVSTHAAWYSKDADLIIVPTDVAFQRGLAQGLSPQQMRVAGQPVAERFCKPIGDRQALRESLGWPNDSPIILLVGGGEGMGPLERTALAIDEAQVNATLVVIAGRNRQLKTRLEEHNWKIPAMIYGFVREMPDFMRAADVLVTKAGPGTISEAFIAELPMILFSRLPGQEDGNVTYVVEQGAGIWAPEPEQVVEALRHWLNDPLDRMRAVEACRRLARPTASRQIARLLAEVIFKNKKNA